MKYLKVIAEGLKICVGMLIGYSIYVFIFMLVLTAAVSGLGWLLAGTFDNPLLFFPIDIAIAIVFGYAVTRPSFRFRLKELWAQIWANL